MRVYRFKKNVPSIIWKFLFEFTGRDPVKEQLLGYAKWDNHGQNFYDIPERYQYHILRVVWTTGLSLRMADIL